MDRSPQFDGIPLPTQVAAGRVAKWLKVQYGDIADTASVQPDTDYPGQMRVSLEGPTNWPDSAFIASRPREEYEEYDNESWQRDFGDLPGTLKLPKGTGVESYNGYTLSVFTDTPLPWAKPAQEQDAKIVPFRRRD